MLIIVAAIVIAVVLVTPVVLSGSGGSPSSGCTAKLRFRQHVYARRPPPSGGATQGVAIGVGVVTGCGRAPSNVNVRSLVGTPASRAIAIDGDDDIYVRVGATTGR